MAKSKKLSEETLNNGSISEIVWKMSIPAIIAMTVNSLYTLIDKIFIGNYVGINGMAAIQYATNIAMAIFALSVVASIGGSIIYSIKFGEGDREGMRKTFANSIRIAFIIGVIITVPIAIWGREILQALGARDIALDLGVKYIRIYSLSIITFFLGQVFIAFGRGTGFAKMAMYTTIISQLVNLVLDFILMEFFDMGIEGAAIATTSAQVLIFIIPLIYYLNSKRHFLPRWRDFIERGSQQTKKILGYGVPAFAIQVQQPVIAAVLTVQIARIGGQDAVGVYSAVSSILFFALMPAFGFRQGTSPILGYNLGKKKYDRLWETFRYFLKIMTFYFLIASIIMVVMPGPFLSMFGIYDSSLGKYMVRIIFATMILLPLQFAFSTLYQSLGKQSKAFIVVSIRAVVILLPAIILLSLADDIYMLFLAYTIADIVSTLVIIPLIVKDSKKIKVGNICEV